MRSLRLEPTTLAELERSLPPEWPEDPWPEIRARLASNPHTLVVVDDDPTGTQTVYDVPVLLTWSWKDLRAEMAQQAPAVYVITNTRSMPEDQARAVSRRVGRAIAAAARSSRCAYSVASRSDSTLRGHFPTEVEALAKGTGERFDAWLLIPYFGEGGRVTVGNVHYVLDGGRLLPVGQTEFARDPVFGYRSSDLRSWVEEKTEGRIRAAEVASVGIEDVRAGPDRVACRLRGLPQGCVCVVNLLTQRDLAVFVAGLLRAEAAGLRYLYRTASSFVAVRSGLPPHPTLRADALGLRRSVGGLIVVGSYVGRTTRQLDLLLRAHPAEAIEVTPDDLLPPSRRAAAVARAAAQAERAIRLGREAIVFTCRTRVQGRTPGEDLWIGRRIAHGLAEIVRRMDAQPRYVLAKGGITSYEVARWGLGARRARVLGQIRPGIPVWRLGQEARAPDCPYVVFPGNVGEDETLLEVVRALQGG